MKPDVPANPTGGSWDDDAITAIDPRGPRATKHRNLLRCVLLLFDQRVLWTDHERKIWRALTGREDANVRALCEAIRESGISIDDMLR